MVSYTFMILLSIFMILNLTCIYSLRSKDNKYKNFILCILVSSIVPFIADGTVTMTRYEKVAEVGYAFFYIGMDIMLFFLLRFVLFYCQISYKREWYIWVFRVLTTFDVISILANFRLHHVYTVIPILPAEKPASDLDALTGGTTWFADRIYYGVMGGTYYFVHCLLVILAIFTGIAILLWKASKNAMIYWVKYFWIAFSLLVTAIWTISVMASTSPIDASLIGYGITVLLIVFFTYYYRPASLINNLLSASIRSSGRGIVLFDNTKKVVFCNQSFADMFGLKTDDYSGAAEVFRELVSSDNIPSGSYKFVRRITDERTGFDVIYEVEVSDVYDMRHEYCGFYASINDRTDEEVEMEKERFLASHDPLTGLYNVSALYRLTDERLAHRDKTEYVAVVSNISGFKLINDVFGTEKADELLKEIAAKFLEITGPEDLVGRITADRFGVLVRKESFDPSSYINLCRSLYMDRGDYKYPVTMHIGVCQTGDGEMWSQTIFDRAFLAIEGLKEELQRVLSHYDESGRGSIIWEQIISASIGDAIRDGDIIPYVQAQISMGQVKGGEVLIRWKHKQEGLLPPGRFLSVLEKTGLIVEVDRYMWESACKILGRWNSEGYDDMYLSVNISPKDFYFTDIYSDITGCVSKYGISPEQLRLEITETAMMNNEDSVLEVIEHLRRDGFIVEMDDFGSGYSSLNTLKNLPVDAIKVDMLFLRNITDADTYLKSTIILSNVINMGLEMGLTVITEGVETEDQKNFLEECGCRNFQGYYFSKPVPVEEFEAKFMGKK